MNEWTDSLKSMMQTLAVGLMVLACLVMSTIFAIVWIVIARWIFG